MPEPTNQNHRILRRMLVKAGIVPTKSQRAEDRKTNRRRRKTWPGRERLADKMFGPAYDPKDQDEIDEKAAERRRRWPVGPGVTEK